jgi:uncharacterized protein
MMLFLNATTMNFKTMNSLINAVRKLSTAVVCGFALIGTTLPVVVQAAVKDDYFVAIKNDNDGDLVTILFRGFDVNAVDAEGRHGLHIAMMESSFKVAKTLIDLSGTKVDTRSKSDESPLMMAALKGHIAFAKRLIERGADVNKTGWTPLHYAATGGHLEMIKLLLEENAYIDAESPNKSTPLMMAAMYGTEDAAKLLLKEGADASIKNSQGLTAADFALQADRKGLSVDLAKAAKAIKEEQNAASAPVTETVEVKKQPVKPATVQPVARPAAESKAEKATEEPPKRAFKTLYD